MTDTNKQTLEALEEAYSEWLNYRDLLKPTTQTNPFLEIENLDIQNYKAHGWNECLIYLQSQGYMNQGWRDIVEEVRSQSWPEVNHAFYLSKLLNELSPKSEGE